MWDAATFTKNRDRLLKMAEVREFLAQVVERARGGLVSNEHFTVDGTLLEAWVSLKSFQAKDKQDTLPDDPGSPKADLHSKKRLNQTPVEDRSRTHCRRERVKVRRLS